jgi:predicted Rossmann-fold nucleotide-binding protein
VETVYIFCGSREGVHPFCVEAAQHMGKILARRRLELVYGGGQVGLMEPWPTRRSKRAAKSLA